MIDKYIDWDEMVYVVVGDKETQFDRLRTLGLGEPILTDKYGFEIDKKIDRSL
ncbi:MAG: hypothetical protein ABJP45_00675 [Cyclobacteriaceae bacterium]